MEESNHRLSPLIYIKRKRYKLSEEDKKNLHEYKEYAVKELSKAINKITESTHGSGENRPRSIRKNQDER